MKVFSASLITLTLMVSTPTLAETRSLLEITVEPTNESVRAGLREVFTQIGKPEFIEIARCESGLVHYKDGRMLPNQQGSSARGILQLMTSMHPDPA